MFKAFHFVFFAIMITVNYSLPMLSLPTLYHFNGTSKSAVSLTNLVCVKGNNARSITFQMKTTVVMYGFGLMPPLIGK